MINIICAHKIATNDYGSAWQNSPFHPSFNPMNMYKLWDSVIYKLFGPLNVNVAPSYTTSVEFGLSYRFHAMYPSEIIIDYENNKSISMNNANEWNAVNILTKPNGLENVLSSISKQKAQNLSLKNVHKSLINTAIFGSLEKGRFYNIDSFNNYRVKSGKYKYKSFDQLCDNKEIAEELEEIYDDIDNVEFYVGIFAESIKNQSSVLSGSIFHFLSSNAGPNVFLHKMYRFELNKLITPLEYKL